MWGLFMNEDKDLINELNIIKKLKIEKKDIPTQLFDNQIPKGLKAYNLRCSILFVDIRHSTKINEKNGNTDMVKIYKMFAKLVIRAVEENNGRVNQIMGDGMLCIFNENSSGLDAFNAALKINHYVKECYNVIVEDSWKIKCGYGIRTGHTLITRIGTRGKNKTCKVAYPSLITNYACKLCNIANENEILMDKATFDQVKNKYSSCKFKEINNYRNTIIKSIGVVKSYVDK